MNHYLVVFDRSRGELLRVDACESSDAAMKARFRAEREHRGQPDIEVVVLGARSEDALRSTHARYFNDIKKLAERGVGMLRDQAGLATSA